MDGKERTLFHVILGPVVKRAVSKGRVGDSALTPGVNLVTSLLQDSLADEFFVLLKILLKSLVDLA